MATFRIEVFLNVYDGDTENWEHLDCHYINLPMHSNIINKYQSGCDGYYNNDIVVKTLEKLYTEVTIYENGERTNDYNTYEAIYHSLNHAVTKICMTTIRNNKSLNALKLTLSFSVYRGHSRFTAHNEMGIN